jgi:hypothetical protein
MKLKLNFDIESLNILDYKDTLLLMGSCFSESIGNKLIEAQIPTLVNPFGIAYNPKSIASSIQRIIDKGNLDEAELIEHKGLFHSMEHHGVFSNENSSIALSTINESLIKAQAFLQEKPTVVITLGTAHVYTYEKTQQIVSNCHKIPNSEFLKRLLSVGEVDTALNQIRNLIPACKVVYTLSPVRHLKDGLVENNRSKAILLQAIHKQVEEDHNTHYFPAYEIMIDELRDYRFYNEDMVHPSPLAIEYIWRAFISAFYNENSRRYIDEAEALSKAKSHRSLYPGSKEDIKFKIELKEKIRSHQTKWGLYEKR